MSSQPLGAHPHEHEHEVIHLGGQAAVVVPIEECQRLRALERHASAEELDMAEAEAAGESFEAWAAAGRPGAVSHEEAMAILLGEKH